MAAPCLDLVHAADVTRAPRYAFAVGSIGKHAILTNEERAIAAAATVASAVRTVPVPVPMPENHCRSVVALCVR